MTRYVKMYSNFLNEKKISVNMPIPKDILEISNAYIKAGKDIFLVGGAVRDFIKGKQPKDYDLVTNALPEESKKILKGFNVSDEQGKNFGVLRVYTKEEPDGYEIASYRKDISRGRDNKGEDQKVEMGEGVTIQDDCNRRDLTINSLFYDIRKGEIVDLVGGYNDIKNGIIRAVGDPNKRFEEDRLRILRVLRFASRMDGKIDNGTSLSIKSDNRLRGIGPKDDVSQERIWDEFQKSFQQSKDFSKYIGLLDEFDMWGEIFPGAIINNKPINSDSFIINIANIFISEDHQKLERKMVLNWKIPIDIARKVVFLISLNDFDIDQVMDFYRSKKRCHISNDIIREWSDIISANSEIYEFVDFAPSVSAEELMNKGFKGIELGKEINRLESIEFKKRLYSR